MCPFDWWMIEEVKRGSEKEEITGHVFRYPSWKGFDEEGSESNELLGWVSTPFGVSSDW